MSVGVAYVLAAAIGAFVALTELLSRYRDAPWAAARTWSGLGYVGFNGLVALAAMYLIRDVFPVWDTTARPSAPTDTRSLVTHALFAGFGAMAILRSSILTYRVSSKDVEVGPAAVIEIIRSTMDRDVARTRFVARADEVQRIMSNVSFVRSFEPLSNIGLNLLGTVDAEERARIKQEIGALVSQAGRSDEDKAYELGLILANSVGFPALASAKNLLAAKIINSKTRPAVVAEQVARLDTDTILRDLPIVCLALNPDVPVEQQKALREQIDAVTTSTLTDRAKRINAGLAMVNIIGEDDFKAAVDLLFERSDPAPPTDTPSDAHATTAVTSPGTKEGSGGAVNAP